VLLLFDIDGTLVQSGGAGRRALERAFEDLFQISGAMTGVRLHGGTDPVIVERAMTLHLGREPSPTEVDRVLDAYLGHLELEIERSRSLYRVMPGVLELLARAEAAGCTIGLATGNVEAGARMKLEPGDLWRRFSFGGYGSDSGDRAELVRRGIARGRAIAGDVPPHRTFVIGDTELDVLAARAAGARAIGVLAGSAAPEALAGSKPDALVETLADPRLHDLLGL
jgi:phosphoglycolate phosphatase-like HAD superfamily hydrolase